MRVLMLTILAIVAFATTGSGDAAADESWHDSQYGWTSAAPSSCKPLKDVCATEDGGATWHGIFNGGTFLFGLVRTSSTAGVVATGRTESDRFWTRDNGRHWYRTEVVRGDFQGSGRYLFLIDYTNVLRQVRPWPPRGRAICKGIWVNRAYSTKPTPRGNICSGAPMEAGMHAATVTTLRDARFGGISNVPGGVIATMMDEAGRGQLRVLLRRAGRNRFVDLPASEEMVPCTAGFNTEPIVTWPRITVLGCGSGAPLGVGGWTSRDGGVSWTVSRP
jgi:hypothetical protein